MADFDASIRAELENNEFFRGLVDQLKAAAESEVHVRDDSGCAKCGCKHIRNVKVPDYKLKLQIMQFLAERGVGRPSAVESVDSEKIAFERVVYLYDAQADPEELGGAAA